jgi:signal transduction histidine kinase
MRINLVQKLRNSLFLKVSLLFSLALLMTIAVLMTAHRFLLMPRRFPAMQKSAVHYARYIMNEIGNPPDIKKARQIADNLNMQIRIENSAQKWASHEDMIGFLNLNLPVFDQKKGIFAGFSDEGLTVAFQRDSSRCLLIMHPRKEGFRYIVGVFVLTIIAFATFLIVAMYFIMRWLLQPVKVLREGVRQLSEGNIDHEMSIKRSDELGQLVDSFNTMTRRIQEMIRSREQLLLDVSHELRSPLTRIKVALEFLKEDGTKKTIKDDIGEVERMIAELLETERLSSRYGGLKLTETDMPELVRQVCAGFLKQKPGIKIISNADDIVLNVDRQRIKVLLRNIIENAMRYSDPQGFPVEISMRQKSDESIIAIQDFGSGIPKQDLPYIFEPFYRVDKSRSKETGGYGLGMSLGKKIMEAHGGAIEITSRLKVGTTVFLKFKKHICC